MGHALPVHFEHTLVKHAQVAQLVAKLGFVHVNPLRSEHVYGLLKWTNIGEDCRLEGLVVRGLLELVDLGHCIASLFIDC